MNIHAADALMEIFGFKRVANDEKPLDNQPSLDDDSGSLNEGMKMSEVNKEGLEVVDVRAIVTDAFISMMESALGMKAPDCAPPAFIQSAIDRAIDRINSEALAGYSVRDARIAELEEEVKTSAECLDMANDLYSIFKRKNDQLRAELAPIPDHSEDVRAMVLPDGYKVAAWCMTDFPANVTVSPEVCASWHRQLFNVSPLYLLAASPSAKGGE